MKALRERPERMIEKGQTKVTISFTPRGVDVVLRVWMVLRESSGLESGSDRL